MKRILAAVMAAVMFAGCTPVETASTTSPSIQSMTGTSQELTTQEATEAATASATTSITEEPPTTTEAPTTATETSTTTTESTTTTTTTTTTATEAPTTTTKAEAGPSWTGDASGMKANLSEDVDSAGLQWKVDPGWIEGEYNGGRRFSYQYVHPMLDDEILISLNFFPIDPYDFLTDDDYIGAFEAYVSSFTENEFAELDEIKHFKDEYGNGAAEYEFSVPMASTITMGSITIRGDNMVVITGTSNGDSSDDFSQVVRDMMDTVEALDEGSGADDEEGFITYEGFGDDVITFEPHETHAIIMISGNWDEDHFAVWAHSPTDSELLVNTTTSYLGTHPDTLNGTNELEIKATGRWKVWVFEWYAISSVTPDEPFEGDGDDILLMEDVDYSKPIKVTITGNRSGRHFAVEEYLLLTKDGWVYADLLVNTTSPYSGTVRSKVGNTLRITADGPWIVEITQ